ncbi:MAG: hypothetical protein WC650_03605 [Candidatus Doudnabacteria bacterium]
MIQKLKKIPKKQEKIFKESDVAVLLENVNDNIKILAEGQTGLNQRMDGLDQKMDGLGKNLSQRIDGLEQEMRDNFKSILQYLSRIEDEIMGIKEDIRELKEKKLDKEKFFILENQFGAMRKDIRECQTFLKIK